MENKLPVTQCQYCGSRDIGEGWQHGEALVTFRKRGLSGNRLRCTYNLSPRKYLHPLADKGRQQ